MGKYDDIISLPHPTSKKHPPMSLEDRAVQFAPFASLTGYGAAVDEAGRLTDERIELDEGQKEILNRKLTKLVQSGGMAKITYFQPDERKSGGAYRTVTDAVVRVDENERRILLAGGGKIGFDEIYGIESVTEGERE